MRELLRALVGQERAVANARVAATALSRRRVEQHEVELYLEALDPSPDVASISPEDWVGAPARTAD